MWLLLTKVHKINHKMQSSPKMQPLMRSQWRAGKLSLSSKFLSVRPFFFLFLSLINFLLSCKNVRLGWYILEGVGLWRNIIVVGASIVDIFVKYIFKNTKNIQTEINLD